MNRNKRKYIGGFFLGLLLLVTTIPIYESSEQSNGLPSYNLLIITADEFENQLNPLRSHKLEMGMKTKLVTLSTVYDKMFWKGQDNPEKIKYFIKNAYDEWGISYVLLVGNFQKMPIRYVYNNDPSFYQEHRYISDLYYADLYDTNHSFSSWNSNQNERFGEWIGNQAQDTNIDLYPEVAVGRLACRTKGEVRCVVRKITAYETQSYQKDWFKRFVVVAGDTYPPGWYDFNTDAIEGEENTKRAIANMTGFTPIRLWASTEAFCGPRDVIRVMSKGCGFMFFEGHATPMFWGTHKPGPENTSEKITGLTNFHIPLLYNGYKLPIIVAGACHNAQFDVSPLRLLEDFSIKTIRREEIALECWAWKLVSHPWGGSIATIANTGLGMTKEDKDSMDGAGDFMDVQFFYEYGNNKTPIIGDVWVKSIHRYIQHYPVDWAQPEGSDAAIDAKTVQQWVLLGDPSLRIGGYP